MKNLQLMSLVALCGGAFSLNAGVVDVTATVNANVNVTSCQSKRGAVTCSSRIDSASTVKKGGAAGGPLDKAVGEVLGSVGEFETQKFNAASARDLGAVAKSSTLLVDVKPGSVDVIKFKPTTGGLANKEVLVAFSSVMRRAGVLGGEAAKVNIYTRLAGSENRDQWFNAGEIIGTKERVAPQSFTLGTDGSLATQKPNESDIAIDQLLS